MAICTKKSDELTNLKYQMKYSAVLMIDDVNTMEQQKRHLRSLYRDGVENKSEIPSVNKLAKYKLFLIIN